MKTQEFDYSQAFDRNLGWLTQNEQNRLRKSSVAIAGVGGAGGYQAQVLGRLGVGRFKIADSDIFELTNFNRQIGATISTVGQSKTAVTKEMILSINPEAQVEIFPEGISAVNIDAFLENVDLALDGIDFFEVDTKILFFEKCYQKKITAVTSCPIGFGASLIVFTPSGMKYDAYFDFKEGMSEDQKRRTLMFGLAPSALSLSYMGKDALNSKTHRAASVSPGLMLVGALTGTESVKIITGKGKVWASPRIYQLDLLTQRVRRKYYPYGMRSFWQRLKKLAIFMWLSIKK